MIKAIFFDFDGVLTSVEGGASTTTDILAKKYGLEQSEVESAYKEAFREAYAKKGIITADRWKEVADTLGVHIPFDELEYALGHPPPNESMIALIHSLKQVGYIIGLITDNPAERAVLLAKTYHFDELFDVVVASGEVGCFKTDSQIFTIALDRAGVRAEQSVFIDNREKNLFAPKDMGFNVYFHHYTEDATKFIHQLSEWGIDV